jgi:hypothetical protein
MVMAMCRFKGFWGGVEFNYCSSYITQTNLFFLIKDPELMDEDAASWDDANVAELNSLMASSPEQQCETYKTTFSLCLRQVSI